MSSSTVWGDLCEKSTLHIRTWPGCTVTAGERPLVHISPRGWLLSPRFVICRQVGNRRARTTPVLGKHRGYVSPPPLPPAAVSVRVVAVMAGHVAATLFGVNREMFAQGARRAPATEKRMETKKAQQLTARQEKKTNIAGRTTRNHRQYHSSNNSSPEKLRFANPTNDETKRGPLTLRMRLRLLSTAATAGYWGNSSPPSRVSTRPPRTTTRTAHRYFRLNVERAVPRKTLPRGCA